MKKKWTEQKIRELELEGRGKGTGADYKPWVQVGDFSSRGFSRRVFSQKTGRVHHLLSELEWHTFLLLEFSSTVLDIREQYPLKCKETLSLATELGIRHPTYPGTHIPTVMTCDFLVIIEESCQRAARAFSCKYANDLENARNIEKQELERSYFKQRDVPHHLVCDCSLPKQKIVNLNWCRSASINLDGSFDHPSAFDEHRQRFINELPRQSSGSLSEYCARYDHLVGAETGSGLRVARAMIWQHELVTDLNMPDLAAQPVQMFRPAPDMKPQVRRA